MKVNTTRYEWEYGHKPMGYGAWVFIVDGKTIFLTPMLYSDATKKAKKFAKVSIEVGL